VPIKSGEVLPMRKPIKVLGLVSLLLILVSFPTCYVGERLVQPELSKLSPEELELRQFDIEYAVYLLPGAVLFLTGGALAAAAAAIGISGYLARRRKQGAEP
jgi:hypothetical protein